MLKITLIKSIVYKIDLRHWVQGASVRITPSRQKNSNALAVFVSDLCKAGVKPPALSAIFGSVALPTRPRRHGRADRSSSSLAGMAGDSGIG